MLRHVILVFTLMFMNFQAKAQIRSQALEICQKNLKHVVTIYRELINNAKNVELEKYLHFTPTNCADLLQMGYNESGVYTIYPKSLNGTLNSELSVYCDMETDGGGWIVFQRRADFHPKQDFYLGWDAYKRGFGQLEKEFWLGNENLHVLTNQENVKLRVDLEDFEGVTRYAEYDDFNISNCEEKYKLIIGKYTGNAGDSLSYHNNQTFATFDSDKNTCAKKFNGAWWYDNCHYSNLNGLYKQGASEHGGVVSWSGFKGDTYSLKKSEMKFRPSNFNKPA